MNLADKILTLRKQNGWSQEELAYHLGVSRQSVSKWESAQALPDLERVIALSELFQVSTDTLMKDSMALPVVSAPTSENGHSNENPHFPAGSAPIPPVVTIPAQRVTRSEAETFLSLKTRARNYLGAGVSMLILSPIPLMLLLVFLTGDGKYDPQNHLPELIGVPTILVMVALGVMVILKGTTLLQPYKYLQTESIELEPGLAKHLAEKRHGEVETYQRLSLLGILMLILAAIPVIVTGIVAEDKASSLVLIGTCITIAMVALGVFLLVISNGIKAAYKQLLQEDDYTLENKAANKAMSPLMAIYWIFVVAVYLVVSFGWDDWHRTWIIWPVAALGSVILHLIFNMVNSRKRKV